MFKKFKEKLDFFNSQFAYCDILPLASAYLIHLEGPKISIRYICYTYATSRGRERSPKYCNHGKTACMHCCPAT